MVENTAVIALACIYMAFSFLEDKILPSVATTDQLVFLKRVAIEISAYYTLILALL